MRCKGEGCHKNAKGGGDAQEITKRKGRIRKGTADEEEDGVSDDTKEEKVKLEENEEGLGQEGRKEGRSEGR